MSRACLLVSYPSFYFQLLKLFELLHVHPQCRPVFLFTSVYVLGLFILTKTGVGLPGKRKTETEFLSMFLQINIT